MLSSPDGFSQNLPLPTRIAAATFLATVGRQQLQELPEELPDLKKVSPQLPFFVMRTIQALALSAAFISSCQSDQEERPEDIQRLKGRFDETDIPLLQEAGVSYQEALKYPKHFSGFRIARLAKLGISSREAQKFPERFSGQDACELVEEGISPEQAGQYPERFSAYDVVRLFGNDAKRRTIIPPEKVNQYPEYFDAQGIESLIRAGISPEEAITYPREFSGGAISIFIDEEITPDLVRQYSGFTNSNILDLVRLEIDPSEALPYLQYFPDPDGVMALITAAVNLETARRYHPRFLSGYDVAKLIKARVSAERAKLYPSSCSPVEIIEFYRFGISPLKAATLVAKAEANGKEENLNQPCMEAVLAESRKQNP